MTLNQQFLLRLTIDKHVFVVPSYNIENQCMYVTKSDLGHVMV